ncbi:MAG: hypothetical protein IJY81_02200 [Lachnospiraceae bacterium]|nr:hypothetical protein [Lachnospiraceae bacterium]
MKKLFNATNLKILAMLTMLIDHVGLILLDNMQVCRVIGRLAFPIFAFFVVEGFFHTKNVKKYMLRMAVFAIISEPIYDFAISGSFFDMNAQNVMFTFLFALIMMYALGLQSLSLRLIGIACAVFASVLLSTDYDLYGIVLILTMYCFRNERNNMILWTSIEHILLANGIQRAAIFSNLILCFYNGEKGKNLKYMFYIFYPLHLLVLGIIAYVY